jgi:menaquinone-dependent protoporphyrinogen oxidase
MPDFMTARVEGKRPMRRMLVLYGTQEGHAARIAQYVAGVILEAGDSVDVRPCKSLSADFDMAAYDAVVLAAPVHNRRHEASVIEFVRQHRAQLQGMPSAFLSVGLVPVLPRFFRQAAADGVAETLTKETAWRPGLILMVAGAIRYREYPIATRLVFQLFMALLGGPTDSSRDHDLTDWVALARFIREFLASVSPRTEAGI